MNIHTHIGMCVQVHLARSTQSESSKGRVLGRPNGGTMGLVMEGPRGSRPHACPGPRRQPGACWGEASPLPEPRGHGRCIKPLRERRQVTGEGTTGLHRLFTAAEEGRGSGLGLPQANGLRPPLPPPRPSVRWQVLTAALFWLLCIWVPRRALRGRTRHGYIIPSPLEALLAFCSLC